MKSKTGRGGGFRGALDYALDEKKEPEIVSSSMSGETPRQLAQEFGVARRLRPDIKKPVYHAALALPKNEHATTEKWDQIAQLYLQKMGFAADTQYVAIRHCDTDYDHIHIIASRVSLSGQVWHGKWDVFKSIEACQQIERELGLIITPGLEDGPKLEKTGTKNEAEMVERTGEDAPRMVLQGLIGGVLDGLEGRVSVPEFAETLGLMGVGVQARMSPGGKLEGLSFEYEGIAFGGRKLGAEYGWRALQDRGVEYDQIRDFEAMSIYIKEGIEVDPREVLKEILSAVLDDLDGLITAVKFCELVQAAGVQVQVNLANTGRLNGFSFGIEGDGEWYSGSKIGKRYGWAQLQKEGVTYEQDGQFEELKRFSPRFSGEEPERNQGIERETGSPSGVDISGGRGGVGELSPDHRVTETDAGRGDAASASTDERALDRDRSSDETADNYTQISEFSGENAGPESPEIDREQPETKPERNEGEAAMVGEDDQLDSGRDAGSDSGPSWSIGFRRSTARRKSKSDRSSTVHMGQSNPIGARVTEGDKQSARAIDPTQYLVSLGFNVKREGRHLSIYEGKDEVYRITCKPDGHWVSCDHYGNGIGDNIALVQDVEQGTSFPDAIYKLTGSLSVDITLNRNVDSKNNYLLTRRPPTLPIQLPEHKRAGRDYLLGRGVSIESIEAAEKCGMLRYCGGGVVFTGTDSTGKVQNATKRAVDPDAEVQKRDFKGSDKQYPPILLGSKDVWIVEGGVDALALRDLYIRADHEPPTVIVTGGANVLSWIDNKDLQPILKDARIVVVAEENEKNEDAKQRADAGHAKQIAALEGMGCKVQSWQTPSGYKDLADYNEQKGDVELRRQQERAQRQADRSHDRDRDQGPEMGM